MLLTYIKDPVDRTLDDQSLGFEWQQLATDGESKAQWEKQVVETLPQFMLQQSGGSEFFRIDGVLLQKPVVPTDLTDGILAQQRAQLNADAANIDKRTAEQFPGGIQGYLDYQQQLAVNEAIRGGKVQVIPVPQGVGVNVTVPQAGP
jgi:hypothetical protein